MHLLLQLQAERVLVRLRHGAAEGVLQGAGRDSDHEGVDAVAVNAACGGAYVMRKRESVSKAGGATQVRKCPRYRSVRGSGCGIQLSVRATSLCDCQTSVDVLMVLIDVDGGAS